MKRHTPHSRGVTLLELLLSAFIIGLIAVATATVLGDGRVLRERTRHRAELALVAQGELDRLRATPPKQLAEGSKAVHREEWPASITATETVRKCGDGFLELSVSAERKAPGGDMTIALTTLHPGGRL